MLRNALTIDVEDYFQVSAFEHHISRNDWDDLPCRVEKNMDSILTLLSKKQVKATFFILGWIAQRYPDLVRRIAAEGHEVASHGFGHQRVTDLTRDEFLKDVTESKRLLEALSGQPVIGYRAPSFSIGEKNLWALDVLKEAGYEYSSSIYPIQHDHYGMPDAPRFRFRPRGAAGILEIPVTTAMVLGRQIPAAGGGYFRLFPYMLSRWLMRRVHAADAESCIFYFHPWEVDPGQPRQHGVGLKTRFRHYVNLEQMHGKISAMLDDFHWGRVDQVFLGQPA